MQTYCINEIKDRIWQKRNYYLFIEHRWEMCIEFQKPYNSMVRSVTLAGLFLVYLHLNFKVKI